MDGNTTIDDAFELMFEEYKDLLYHVAFKILQDRYLAEDAVNTTFWRALENFSKISKPVCPKTKQFLAIICERVSIDLLRKYRQEENISLDALDYNIIDTTVSVLPEEEGSLQAAIARLPKAYREVILLRYSYGYSAHEIAQMLSYTEMKVYKTIERGKRKLAELLQQEKDDNDI